MDEAGLAAQGAGYGGVHSGELGGGLDAARNAYSGDALGGSPASDPYDMSWVKPIPVKQFNGVGIIKDGVMRAMAPHPDDTAEDIALRFAKGAEFNRGIEQLGALTPDQATAIFNQWHSTMAPAKDPYEAFSAEAQSALRDAFAPDPELKTTADLGDVDQSAMLATIGYGLGQMLRGKGGFADAVRSIGPLVSDAQKKLDAKNAKTLEDAKLQREMNLEKYHRLTAVADDQAKQQGYLEHDLRLTDRQNQNAQALADRQEQADQRKFQHQMAASYFTFLASGQSERAAQVKAYAEQMMGVPLDDSFNELKPTTKEQLDLATIGKIGDDRLRIQAITKGLGFQNEIQAKTFDDQVRIIRAKAEKADDEVKLLDTKIKQLPEQFKAQIGLMYAQAAAAKARASAAITSAQAALERAKKAGSAGDPTKDLRALITSRNSSIDNKMATLTNLARQIDDLVQKKRIANGTDGKGQDEPNPAYDQQIQNLQTQATTVDKQRRDEMKAVDDEIKKLESTVGGAK